MTRPFADSPLEIDVDFDHPHPNDPIDPLDLIAGPELAEKLGCDLRTIQRLVDRGGFPEPLKIGALRRWSRAAVAKWISDQDGIV